MSAESGQYRFLKSHRLRKRGEFKALFLSGKKYFSDRFQIQYAIEGSSTKLGISVSKKFGKSHLRNRFKRVLREAYRKMRSSLPLGLKLHIAPNKSLVSLALSSDEAGLELLRFREALHDFEALREPQSPSAESR